MLLWSIGGAEGSDLDRAESRPPAFPLQILLCNSVQSKSFSSLNGQSEPLCNVLGFFPLPKLIILPSKEL